MINLEHYYVKDRTEWRVWLEANHTNARGLWLVYYKKHNDQPSVAYSNAVEEALCLSCSRITLFAILQSSCENEARVYLVYEI